MKRKEDANLTVKNDRKYLPQWIILQPLLNMTLSPNVIFKGVKMLCNMLCKQKCYCVSPKNWLR